MKLHRLATITVLGLHLALVPYTTSAAGRPAPAPATPQLSATERTCQALGIFALSRAQDRDNGFAMLATLALVRQWDQAHDVTPFIRQIHEEIHLRVYEAWQVSPTQLQQLTELACMQGVGPGNPPRPTTTPSQSWR